MAANLDLNDRFQVIDFIQQHAGFLSDADRKKVEARMELMEAGKSSPTTWADLALHVGRNTWTARQALAQYLETPNGCDEEWRKVASSVSAGTAHLLERFKHGTKCESLDAVLAHDESGTAFRDSERSEIAHVRTEIETAIWKEKKKQLGAKLKEAEQVLSEIVSRLDIMRTLAADTPSFQSELLGKISRWENDLYFAGKVIDTGELDDEIRYYRETKENPIE